MSVPKELEYILDLVKEPEIVRQMLDVPEGYRVVKITDEFREGGPVIISKEKILTPEEERRNKERIENVAYEVAVETAKQMLGMV